MSIFFLVTIRYIPLLAESGRSGDTKPMSAPLIHPTAVVDPKASLGQGVHIGPYCTVGAGVVLGNGVKLVSHVVVDGDTHIGDETVVYPFATLGLAPQDLKYKGEVARVRVGGRNQIREHVTIHMGTETGRMETTIGDGNLFMVGVHVAHDCIIANNCVFANNATLAGHVEVADNAVLGGLCAVHQFVRIGTLAMVGGMTGVEADVIPYGMVTGNRAHLQGLNLVGLQRAGFEKADIAALRKLYAELFEGQGTFAERLAAAQTTAHAGLSQTVLQFVTAASKRGLSHPAK